MPKKRGWELRDPGASAEAQSYTHPVPSRTYIRQFLEKRGAPAPFGELVQAFALNRRERNAHRRGERAPGRVRVRGTGSGRN